MSPHALAEFWDMARFAKSSLTNKQRLGRVAMELEGLEQALHFAIGVQGAVQILAQGFSCELLLTNLGKLSVQYDSHSLKLKALWGPFILMGFDQRADRSVTIQTIHSASCTQVSRRFRRFSHELHKSYSWLANDTPIFSELDKDRSDRNTLRRLKKTRSDPRSSSPNSASQAHLESTKGGIS